MKQNPIYIIFLTLLILTGCTHNISEKKGRPPADLIPRNEMVDIITDMHLYDAVMKEKQKKHNKISEPEYYMYQAVMKKHDITREQFESSLKYYQQDLEDFDKIYEDVIERLSKMKAKVDSK